jgi:hypothetical protein
MRFAADLLSQSAAAVSLTFGLGSPACWVAVARHPTFDARYLSSSNDAMNVSTSALLSVPNGPP